MRVRNVYMYKHLCIRSSNSPEGGCERDATAHLNKWLTYLRRSNGIAQDAVDILRPSAVSTLLLSKNCLLFSLLCFVRNCGQ